MTTPAQPDRVAGLNQRLWDAEVARGAAYTRPFIDVDCEAMRAFAERRASVLPSPWDAVDVACIPADRAAGMRVLCLAAGGGQQSVLFGLLGADVTVLDLCAGQLAADRRAAEHYGYPVTTLQGDMRDLSQFTDAAFDLVWQPISICFVPDLAEVYGEVARVLRPGSRYRVDHVNPATHPASFDGPRNGWDGVGYRIAEPYRCGPILKRADGSENMSEGEPIGEFRHGLSSIFNELVRSGFAIEGVWESACHVNHDPKAEPGTDAHFRAHIAEYFTILARRQDREPAINDHPQGVVR